MNIEAPTVARRLFARLCKGDNLLLSGNGAGDDADLYRQVEAEEEPCREYFLVLGLRLQRGDNCYYFTTEDEPQSNVETKLDKMIHLVRLLDFLSTHIDSFGEGVIFSAATLAARCNGDPKGERFLEEKGKGSNHTERLEGLLQSLVRQGYLSEYDTTRQEYRVLSSINYLFDFADRIQIHEEEQDKEDEHAPA
jgi:hypothetical protein